MVFSGLQVDQGFAAIVVVLITIFSSAVALVFNFILQGWQESRAQYREMLGRHIEDVGRLTHEILALSDIAIQRYKKGHSYQSKLNLALTRAVDLGKIRIRVKYPLWRVLEGIRTLERVPSWVSHTIAIPEVVDSLILMAEELREVVDDEVRKAYLKGRAPGYFAGEKIGIISYKIRKKFESGVDY